MEIYTKKEIRTLPDWKNSVSVIQWTEGRSAFSLAYYFCEKKKKAHVLINKMLEYVSEKEKISPKLTINKAVAEIEHHSKFDNYGKGRMQDLAIWENGVGKMRYFIGIEAKVDEPFNSQTIGEAKNDKKDRVEDLIERYLPNRNEKGIDEMRYQLLYYLAGSVCENSDLILMPILVFKTESYNDNRGDNNKKDFEKFFGGNGMKFKYKKIKDFEVYYGTVEDKSVYVFYAEIDAKDWKYGDKDDLD